MTAIPPLPIGLPVHNGQNHVIESLGSPLAQCHPDVELVTPGNASTDGIVETCHGAHDLRRPRSGTAADGR